MEGEECLQEHSNEHGAVVLLEIEMLREHQKGDTDCSSLVQWGSETASASHDVLKASNPYFPLLALHFERIAEVDQMLLLREEVDTTNRFIVTTSLIGEDIEEGQQWPGTA